MNLNFSFVKEVHELIRKKGLYSRVSKVNLNEYMLFNRIQAKNNPCNLCTFSAIKSWINVSLDERRTVECDVTTR